MRFRLFSLAVAAVFLGGNGQFAHVFGQESPLPLAGPEAPSALEELESELGYLELTRGPVHEAFAEQVSLDPTPGVIVPKGPPEPIEEVPPSDQPAGENVLWIDGYWAFSEDEDDYIWVSGGWRIAPRDYQWVPGHWNKVEAGFQWIGGFWATADRDEVGYLPPPPDSLEEGPTSVAPGEDYFWIPGCWYYQDARYAWRPGYWGQMQPNYVWIPHYYRWTPSGCILAGGYWDYSLASRGYLFAPIYFQQPVYRTNGWRYTPQVALDLGPLHFHLFVRPNYCHYYFGDYYGDRYLNNGWFAWHDYYGRRRCYDPLFAFNVARYRRHGVDFHDRSRRWHKYFRDHEDFRPKHTFKKQKDFIARHQDRDRNLIKTVSLGDSFNDVVRNKKDKFVRLDDSRRSQVQDARQRFNNIRRERSQLEVADRQIPRIGDRSDNDRERGQNFPRFRLPGREGITRDSTGEPSHFGNRVGFGNREDGERPSERRSVERGDAERGNAERGNAERRSDQRPAFERGNFQRGTIERRSPERGEVDRRSGGQGNEAQNRTPRIELNNRSGRGQLEGRTRSDPDADATPRFQPRPSGSSEFRQRLQERSNNSERNASPFQQRRSNATPSPATRSATPEIDRSPRSTNSPRSFSRPSNSAESRPAFRTRQPSGNRPAIRSRESGDNRPSFRSRDSGARQPSRAIRSQGRSTQQFNSTRQQSVRPQASRGNNRVGNNSNRGNSNQSRSSPGNSRRGRKKNK